MGFILHIPYNDANTILRSLSIPRARNSTKIGIFLHWSGDVQLQGGVAVGGPLLALTPVYQGKKAITTTYHMKVWAGSHGPLDRPSMYRLLAIRLPVLHCVQAAYTSETSRPEMYVEGPSGGSPDGPVCQYCEGGQRFDWSLEVTRAKALIASGEAEFEIDEDPVPIGLPNDRSELDL
eukprot:1160239-Pelagomonas_calceolata.AAC.5